MIRKDETRIRFWGGLRTIGGTIVTVQYKDTKLVFDFGTTFDPGADGAAKAKGLPPIDGLYEPAMLPREGVLPAGAGTEATAILISHLHLDHCGAVGRTAPQIPIYLSSESAELYRDLAVIGEENGDVASRLRPCAYDRPVPIGDMHVTFMRVDHDIPGACGLLIETPNGRIAYTGDLRMHGLHPEYTRSFIAAVRAWKPDVLIIEGTTLRDADTLPDEALAASPELPRDMLTAGKIAEAVAEAVAEFGGLAVFNMYLRDRERILAMLAAARLAGRQAVLEPETAYLAAKYTEPDQFLIWNPGWRNGLEAGHPERPGAALPAWLMGLFSKYRYVGIKDINAEAGAYFVQNSFAHLTRLAELDHRNGVYIHSNGMPLGPYDPAYAELQSALETLGLTYRPIHVTGHALPQHLTYMVEEMAPRIMVPLHSLYPERLACKQGTVLLPETGLSYRLAEGRMERCREAGG